ncbi:MAG: hypothetical protein OEM91_16280 [Hyphomicrobiales bacterium]|nr:hypothetical protein [Hyphomicrobiales bacterium]
MKVLEVYSDESGETHFKEYGVSLSTVDFAPPSPPLKVSDQRSAKDYLFIEAPPGWDDSYHATPRKQLGVLLSGQITVTSSRGQAVELGPGSVFLLNDEGSKGHLTKVIGSQNANFLLIGLDQ